MELNHYKRKAKGKSSDYAIEIHEAQSTVLAATIEETLPQNASSICSIYRVPIRLQYGDQKRYKPIVASIGPYHHKTQAFIVSENHKRWYLHNLISRSTPPKSITDLVMAIKGLEDEARASYAEDINLTSDDFVTLMVVDGCFIIELLCKVWELESKVDSTDLIFSGNSSVLGRLRRDLVLLENQLPLIVLNCLFQKTMDSNHRYTLHQLIRNFLKPIMPTNIIREDDRIKGEHILDLVRNLILPSSSNRRAGPCSKYSHEGIYPQHCATELQEVGITFKINEKAASLVDITFNANTGVLEIPQLIYGRGVKYLIPNLIALERSHPSRTKAIISYAMLLDSLIKSKDDVQLLYTSGIIDKVDTDHKAIASDFNRLCPGLKTSKFFQYVEVCDSLNQYCGSGWPRVRRMLYKWNVILRRDYFGTPWAIISFIAAGVLLVLTFTQTLYTVAPPR